MKTKPIWKRGCACLLGVALLLGQLPVGAMAGEDDYYCDENGGRNDLPISAVDVTSEKTVWDDEWYIVSANATIDERVEVSGDVKLVLCDGVNLKITKGIHVSGNDALTVYGQSLGNGMIEAQSGENEAAIGSNENENGGRITINGGEISAISGTNAAGIGGGARSAGTQSAITINGGKVYAKGNDMGAGIGGGSFKSGSTGDGRIQINGGNVVAQGGNYGAGIGGGQGAGSGVVEINAGYVVATGKGGSAGIGSGYGSNSDNHIIINGGKVEAYGSTYSETGAAGIGGGDKGAGGNITIMGGDILAVGGDAVHPGDGIGNGGGYSEETGALNVDISNKNECPVIRASSVAGDSSAWSGIVFENGVGAVYGDQTLSQDLTIAEDETLCVPADTTLVVPDLVKLTNNGCIHGSGTILGQIAGSGMVDGVTVGDGKVQIATVASPEAGGTVTGGDSYAQGAEVRLVAVPAEGFHFVEWREDGNTLVGETETISFEAKDDRSLTAVFAPHTLGAWQHDADVHWQTCADCGANAGMTAHSGGTATCQERAVCSVCGAPYGAADGHVMVHHKAVAASCTESGMREYWHCTLCGGDFADAAGTTACDTLEVAALGHALSHRGRIAPTTSSSGLAAHYACTRCERLFLDADGRWETSLAELVIPPLDAPSYEPPAPEVVIADADHGRVNVSQQVPGYGEWVTLTVEPDDGYALDSLVVRDRHGKALTLEKLSDSQYRYRQPWGRVTIEATFVECAAEPEMLPFTDVAADAWYHDAVAYTYRHGLMMGTSASTFAPETVMTRAMAVAVLHHLAGSPEASGLLFNDVEADDWVAPAVRWAAAKGIVHGFEDGNFRPDAHVTREQLAAMLQNAACYAGMDTSVQGDLSAYTDAALASDWAEEALIWATTEGILRGTSAATLAPQEAATRAQTACILERFDRLE